MVHLTDEDLLTRLDGEVDGAGRDGVAAHLSACVSCRSRMAGLRATLGACAEFIQLIDAAEPPEWSGSAPGRVPLKVSSAAVAQRSRTSVRGEWRWAAVMAFLLLAAGVSASVLTYHRAATVDARLDSAPAVQPAATPHAGAVIVSPSDGMVRIAIYGAGPAPYIDAAMHARPDVLVSITGAAVPRFAAQDGAVTVMIDDPAVRVEIRFPHTLRNGSVNADGVEVIRVANGAIVSPH